jgi:hypothetical protein
MTVPELNADGLSLWQFEQCYAEGDRIHLDRKRSEEREFPEPVDLRAAANGCGVRHRQRGNPATHAAVGRDVTGPSRT